MTSEQSSTPTQEARLPDSAATLNRSAGTDARSIYATMERGASPLDFIKKNLAKAGIQGPDTAPTPKAADVVERPTKEDNTYSELAHNSSSYDTHPDDVFSTKDVRIPEKMDDLGDLETIITTRKNTKEEESQKVEPDLQEEETLENPIEDNKEENSSQEDPIKKNLSKQRQIIKRLKQEVNETARVKSELEEKVKKYETGEATPEYIEALQSRVENLEYYEKLHNLKVSDEYAEAFIEPLSLIDERLAVIAENYSIPKEVLVEASNLENEADINRFLSRHFDSVGGYEVKNLITQKQNIASQAREAEKNAGEALRVLKEQSEVIKAQKEQQRKERIINVSKNSWVKAISSVKEQGIAKELIPIEGDSEFNSKVVTPKIQSAAREYGKIMNSLIEAGLKDIPEEVSKAIALSALYSHAYTVASLRATEAENYADTLKKTTERLNPILRPQIGQSQGGSPNVSAAAPKTETPLEAGRNLIHSVLSKSR